MKVCNDIESVLNKGFRFTTIVVLAKNIDKTMRMIGRHGYKAVNNPSYSRNHEGKRFFVLDCRKEVK